LWFKIFKLIHYQLAGAGMKELPDKSGYPITGAIKQMGFYQ